MQCQDPLHAGKWEIVLPDAEPHIGISYICQNALKHLSALYMQPGFESLLYKCIFYCRTEEEFESKCVSFVKTHGSVVYTSQEKDGLVCSSRKNFHAGPQHEQEDIAEDYLDKTLEYVDDDLIKSNEGRSSRNNRHKKGIKQ
ncbi:hypothetical protein POTOM_025923 [Populus tomentosa]|uniref:Uncharacterized protein n=1 Tax=Populus tomentosa TaxID=118781 RepID=A0A8X7ZLY2_POPTO|nr:hypothetical protein POTOM_025923 [Populus tomentosa]